MIDKEPFPNVCNSQFAVKEFSIGAMLPTPSSQDISNNVINKEPIPVSEDISDEKDKI